MKRSDDELVKLCFDAGVEIMPKPARLREVIALAEGMVGTWGRTVVWVDYRARVYARRATEDGPWRARAILTLDHFVRA